jgi:nitrite reductase/ring-hydroxylating ferredoxin subunit
MTGLPGGHRCVDDVCPHCGLGANDLLAGHNLSSEVACSLQGHADRTATGHRLSPRKFSAFMAERLKRRKEMLVTTSNETLRKQEPTSFDREETDRKLVLKLASDQIASFS